MRYDLRVWTAAAIVLIFACYVAGSHEHLVAMALALVASIACWGRATPDDLERFMAAMTAFLVYGGSVLFVASYVIPYVRG